MDASEEKVEERARILVVGGGFGGLFTALSIEGAEQYALPFRKIRHADELRARMIDALDRIQPDAAPQDARRASTYVIVGGGASGVELATKMSDLLRDAF